MAVLVDPPLWPAHGRRWSHLVSDVSIAELHDFAARVGIPRRAFEGDHYDIPEERYEQLIAAGAAAVPGRELLRRLCAAGLRRPKRRGEAVVASLATGPSSRLDAVRSLLPPPCPGGATTLLADAASAVRCRRLDVGILPSDPSWRRVGYLRSAVTAPTTRFTAYEAVWLVDVDACAVGTWREAPDVLAALVGRARAEAAA